MAITLSTEIRHQLFHFHLIWAPYIYYLQGRTPSTSFNMHRPRHLPALILKRALRFNSLTERLLSRTVVSDVSPRSRAFVLICPRRLLVGIHKRIGAGEYYQRRHRRSTSPTHGVVSHTATTEALCDRRHRVITCSPCLRSTNPSRLLIYGWTFGIGIGWDSYHIPNVYKTALKRQVNSSRVTYHPPHPPNFQLPRR